jgi:hypothetical protein
MYITVCHDVFQKYNPFSNFRLNSYDETIGIIHNVGGLSIWAHKTFNYNCEDVEYFGNDLKYFIKLGLNGIEMYHSTISGQTKEVFKFFVITKKYSLLESGEVIILIIQIYYLGYGYKGMRILYILLKKMQMRLKSHESI